MILNIYAQNTRVHDFISETLLQLKLHIDPNTVTVDNFNISFSSTNKSSTLGGVMRELNSIINQMNLTGRRCFEIDHILGYKAVLTDKRKTEITPCIFSDHNSLRSDINTRNSRKCKSS